LFSAFGAFTGFGGWAFLYTPSLRFYYSFGIFIFIFLLCRSFFEFTPKPNKNKLVSSLGLALLMTECFWATGFLPQHFTALGLGLTAVFYVSIVVNYHYLFDNLDFKKIQFHLLVAAACVIMVFLSSPWRIAV
jgi:hypothetical protein